MAKESNSPSIREVAFDCPFCGAYAAQTWFQGKELSGQSRTPNFPDRGSSDRVRSDENIPEELRQAIISHVEKILSGLVIIKNVDKHQWVEYKVENLNLSRCFVCEQIAVWVHDRLIFPRPVRRHRRIRICRTTRVSTTTKRVEF